MHQATPDNPTGGLPDWDQVEAVARHVPQSRIVIDEAFLRLSEGHEALRRTLPNNVIRMRSLTKELAMPGLRVGYLVASPQTVEDIRRVSPPWSVGEPAQQAALTGVRHGGLADDARRRMRTDVEALRTELAATGLEARKTATVYTLVPCPNATQWARQARAEGVLIRDCTSFGLPHFLRLVGRPGPDRVRLLETLSRIAACHSPPP